VAILKVRLTPKSSREEIQFVDGIARVWVRAAPSDGEANEAMCRLLAKRLAIAKSLVTVLKGHSSRSKTVSIGGIDQAEMQQRLAES